MQTNANAQRDLDTTALNRDYVASVQKGECQNREHDDFG